MQVDSKGGPIEEQHSFKKLNVWQKAYLFVLAIYKQTQNFPSFELYGLTSQIRRGAVSILANIAEGSERQYKKESVQFLSVARGSLAEVETYLMLSRDLGYMTKDEFVQLEQLRKEIGRLLRGLSNSLLRLAT
jgi:four helix bundle protein